MSEINTEQILREHCRSEHLGGLTGLSFCEAGEHEVSTYWPCEKAQMAMILGAVRGYAEGLADAPSGAVLLPPNAVAADLFTLLEVTSEQLPHTRHDWTPALGGGLRCRACLAEVMP